MCYKSFSIKHGENIREVERDNMERIIKHCFKLINAKDIFTVDDIHQIAYCRRQLNCILKYNTHPSRLLNYFLPYSIRNY